MTRTNIIFSFFVGLLSFSGPSYRLYEGTLLGTSETVHSVFNDILFSLFKARTGPESSLSLFLESN